VNYETGSGTSFTIYGGSSSSLYAAFTGAASIRFPGLAAGSGHNCLQIDNSGYVTNTGSACGSSSGGSGTVSWANSGQIAYYTGNGTSVGGMSAVPLTSGGTGAVNAAAALQNLSGISSTVTSQQTIAGPLNVPTAYATSTGAYQLSATRGLAGYVTPELYGAYGDGTHDDTVAIQACWNASSTSSLECRMSPSGGGTACGTSSSYGCYLVNGQLTVQPYMHVEGNSLVSTLIKSEYNGPAVVMANGPVNGVVMKNLNFVLDKALANSAGFYFQAVASSGNGGLWYSEFQNISVDNPAKECLRLDGGGTQPGYAYNLPNQFLQFDAFNCNGPPGQSHPANLVEFSGQAGQIVFRDGSVNGDATSTGTGTGITYTYYPNPLVLIQPVGGTTTNIAPGNITFSNFAVQSGQIGYNLVYSQNINILDGSHAENLGTFLEGGSSTFTVDNGFFGNVGTSTGGLFSVGGSMRGAVSNSTITADGSHPIAALASCGSDAQMLFQNNAMQNQNLSTSGCVTGNVSVSSATLTYFANTTLVNGDNCSTPVTTLSGPTDPGQTVTLIAWTNKFCIASGGSISLGQYVSPLSVPVGSLVTLRRLDLGQTYAIEAVSAAMPMLPSSVAGYNGNSSGIKIPLALTWDTPNQLTSVCHDANGNLTDGGCPGYTPPTQYKTWSCQPGLGDGTSAITTATYYQTTCRNDSGSTYTITGLACFTDNSGSSTLSATDGSSNALLTGAITCSSSWAAGTQSSTATIAAGGYVKFTFFADGTSKQATFDIHGTY
jgi:hypothetical protein